MKGIGQFSGLALLMLAVIGLSGCAMTESVPTSTFMSIEAPTLAKSAAESTNPAPVITAEATEAQAPQASATPPQYHATATAQPEMVISTEGAATPALTSQTSAPVTCAPTAMDMLGPFYTPGAPVRDKVGEGYILTGVVRSAEDCSPIQGAQIDVWMAGPDGEYKDDFRAVLFSQADGSYRFESHFPPPYTGRPPHIHLLVHAPGFISLVTQHYPGVGELQAAFDLVLLSDS